ncbi:MAG: hypothetical protein HYY21_08715 [Candidatus Tectomicrobia bacterium]|nr:hypothetical protein [Candidatus Tectomicrobia bacterium]
MKALASLTPEESKALIARALWALAEMKEALRSGTIVIAADTTTVHVAREFWEGAGKLPPEDPGTPAEIDGLLRRYLPLGGGDSWVIREGRFLPEYDLLKVINGFQARDVFIKGANAIDAQGLAGAFVRTESGGAVQVAMGTVLAKGSHFLVPVGVERVVFSSVVEISRRLGIRKIARATGGPVGFLPLPGRVVTEIEAMEILAGVTATHVGSGGTLGAEGTITLHLEGAEREVLAALELVNALKGASGSI